MNKTRIILLIDFSPVTESLFAAVAQWLKNKEDVHVKTVHRLNVQIPALTDNDSKEKIVDLARQEKLQAIKALQANYLSEHKYFSVHVSDEPLLRVVEMLGKEPGYQNLMVLGLKGTSLGKKAFIGSNAIAMIETMDMPIIALNKGFKLDMNDYQVAVSSKYSFNQEALSLVLQLTETNKKLQLHFFTFAEEAELDEARSALDSLMAQFKRQYSCTQHLMTSRNQRVELQQYMVQRPDAFLVLQRGNRNILDILFRKLTVNELAYEGNLPLIILPQ